LLDAHTASGAGSFTGDQLANLPVPHHEHVAEPQRRVRLLDVKVPAADVEAAAADVNAAADY
jgi:hypothetical protein